MSSPPANNRDQQFCLRWNNYQSNLTQVFNQLFQSESFVDVTLACEGHSVKAHRLVLSACSPYFLTVLTETSCSHPVIILQGVKWSELKAVVEFMYKGEINICQEQLASLLRVAENLKIRGLADVGGEEAEAVLTSPSESPRVGSQFWATEDSTPRKRRRLSDEPRSRSRSRSPSPGPHTPHTPASVNEPMDTIIDMPGGNLSRGSSAASNPPPPLPSPSPVASLASSLSSLAHLHGPMPPPGPPLPPHLAHLPPLSPLSPLLNMHHHPMSRHHSPEDFEIRPGIAEMIREEERRVREFPEMAKLLESTHHWIGNPMADSYQAQVQAAWQKSWNQTQSLLQNLRFRERGPLKSWRPETMAEAIHAVLKEGLSLSQAARKYDIPYPTFVLYANRVHNLLGPSHEPGDMRPKGRGRPQRILLGAWPEDQIKGVIRAVVFRDTTVFRDGDHKENKKPTPTPPQIKEEAVCVTQSSSNGHFTPNPSSLTPNGTPDKSGNSTPIPPSTPSTSQPLLPGGIGLPLTTPPTPGSAIPLPSPLPKDANISNSPDVGPQPENNSSSATTSTSSTSTAVATTPNSQPLTTSSNSESHTPHSRPSSANSTGQMHSPQQNGISNAHSYSSGNNANINTPTSMNGMVAPGMSSPVSTNGGSLLGHNSSQSPLSQNSKPPHISVSAHQQLKSSLPTSQHSHMNHQQSPLHNNAQMQQRNPHYPHPNHQHPSRHQQNPLGPIGGPQQMLGLIAGGLSPSSIGTPPAHMARLFGEGPPHMSHRPPQPPMNAFHPGFPRPTHPGMQPMSMHNPMNSIGPRLNLDDHEPSPEAILFGKLSAADRQPFNQTSLEISGRQIASNPFDTIADTPTNAIERPMMFRDSLDTIKSEPEAIMN